MAGMAAQAVFAALAAVAVKKRVREACTSGERVVVRLSSPSSLSSSISNSCFAVFLVCLAGRGETVGKSCVSGTAGAGAEGAAGGASGGDGARFIGRCSQAALDLGF